MLTEPQAVSRESSGFCTSAWEPRVHRVLPQHLQEHSKVVVFFSIGSLKQWYGVFHRVKSTQGTLGACARDCENVLMFVWIFRVGACAPTRCCLLHAHVYLHLLSVRYILWLCRLQNSVKPDQEEMGSFIYCFWNKPIFIPICLIYIPSEVTV